MHAGKMIHHGAFAKQKKHPMIVVFRGLFDYLLKVRYKFYAQLTNGDFATHPKDKANVGLESEIGQDDDMNVMVAS